MPISFPLQVNGQVADANFINDLADAVESHDALLTDLGVKLHGTGKLLTTAATKATTASTTDVAVTDYTMNADIPAGRLVEFCARLRVQSTVAGDAALVRLKTVSVSGSVIGEHRIPITAAATPYEHNLVFPWRSTGPGLLAFLLTVQRVTGTGSITVTTAGASLPGILYARDLALETRFTIV